ncbi:S41 family peptidase [Tissierella sp.]|uniref:S41 family peptidase n=1 Tax=Tissierella sp. TaxID=41274 RepID=UPI00285A3A3F|nr:S41 family peptidase [Tissierella sp.]MDR7855326.1 S41 family peptidase [Tissierella sp.]
MTKKWKRRLIIATLIILSTVTLERTYNSRDEFQVTAMDASDYEILEANLTTKEKLQDFEYLYDLLEKNYPFFKVNERLHGIDWLSNKRKYERLIRNTKNDAEFFVAMDRILDDLNNGHVNIFNGGNYREFYKVYYLSYAKYNALRYLPWYEALTNPHVMNRYKFDGNIECIELYQEAVLETKVLIEDKLAYMKIKKMANFDVVEEDYFKISKFLKDVEGYEKLIIDIRGNGGGYNVYWTNIVELLTDETLTAKYHVFFKDGHRNNLDVYKVRNLRVISELDEETLNQFPHEVKDFDFYNTYSIRINPWNKSLDTSDLIDFNGKIYLLVDKGVFSASEKFASFAKDSGFATLVGETTGGDRVFEEIPLYFLYNSKFVIRYSRELGINADGTINMETKTTPHIYVDPTPHEDFNKDECIQAVIKDNL